MMRAIWLCVCVLYQFRTNNAKTKTNHSWRVCRCSCYFMYGEGTWTAFTVLFSCFSVRVPHPGMVTHPMAISSMPSSRTTRVYKTEQEKQAKITLKAHCYPTNWFLHSFLVHKRLYNEIDCVSSHGRKEIKTKVLKAVWVSELDPKNFPFS